MKEAMIDDFTSLTIGEAGAARERILSGLSGFDSVSIRLDNLEAIDLAGLQALISFFCEARALGKTPALTGSIAPGVRQRLCMAGLCEGACETGEQLSALIWANG